MNPPRKPRLLLFNLMTDADDPILGFTTVWINALATRCEAVDVITMQAGKLEVSSNVQVYSVGKEKGYSEPRRALEFYRILFRLLRQNRYDACFVHMIQLFAVMGAPLLKAYRVPVTLWYAHKAVSRMLKLAEKLVDHVVTSSPEGFRLPSSKRVIVGQGIDTNLFRPSEAGRPTDSPFTLISLGRIAPIKRLETMIEAVKELAEANGKARVRLRLVGSVFPQDAAYAQQLHNLIERYDLANVVELAEPVAYEQVAGVYQHADVMVNMSATGSMDKAVLEAMACGIPVVTVNEAFQAVLAPWKETVLIPPNEPELLPARLQKLMAMSADERAKLGAELRELVVAEHSLERLVDKLLAIF